MRWKVKPVYNLGRTVDNQGYDLQSERRTKVARDVGTTSPWGSISCVYSVRHQGILWGIRVLQSDTFTEHSVCSPSLVLKMYCVHTQIKTLRSPTAKKWLAVQSTIFQTYLTAKNIMTELPSEQTWGNVNLEVGGRKKNQHTRSRQSYLLFLRRRNEIEIFQKLILKNHH